MAVLPLVSNAELAALARACELAERGAGSALPNPVVGCVLLSPDGEVIGEGFHERAGGPHAEAVALAAAGPRAAGATAVVTLEPCNHTGRTPPCSQALIDAGVARVIIAVRDPWPPAAGGADRLRAAGVQVIDLSSEADAPDSGPRTGSALPPIAAAVDAARDVNRVWLGSAANGRPFVTLKIAMSLDGRVAAPDGTSRWITSPASRADAHELRRRVDAIMVGIGTVLADDPQLTARGADGVASGRQPLRVVVDSNRRIPVTAKVFDDVAATLIATVERFGAGPDGRVDLHALLRQLHRDGRRHLLLEGGPRLAAAMLDQLLVDEVLIYLAPLLLGAGRAAVEGGALGTLSDAQHAELRDWRRLGPDIALRYRLRSTAP